MSELRSGTIDVPVAAFDNQCAKKSVMSNVVDAFHNVADDVQVKLWDEIEALKKMISETGESNAADMAEFRSAFLEFKTRVKEKVDALERGTIIAAERLVGSDKSTDSAENY
mmetsp:Transcript_31998/g.46515  ORF Transcript_31998/g.46515 Transcript_31998/m.46515 type:complete len:112 (-) Transcript_31998:317-652(-)|eukprot:CAMPEP_0116006456 /NCGR_PEP_ID=MMETSP0321-20121206/1739_1 /TAXON_ID=163516 /ORGANISM="Leptocylindrus danicus var. danicus, Strain B650" /LENGTH=111 /DNA_ID=CAMNT_0003475013 /DNA_START=255 /DNA_END=590 /DNA_ORIENTATION=-